MFFNWLFKIVLFFELLSQNYCAFLIEVIQEEPGLLLIQEEIELSSNALIICKMVHFRSWNINLLVVKKKKKDMDSCKCS